ncbi:hypothetical protein B0A49_10110 [Cryomyces minteri]|uniref:Transcription factor domain-containing protein n=1 Tax=Cryomyces minteri TaxID=331657 RepID=A0A4U0WXZ0_9PEZI|nr:hypothetical protein B0A49_10110 [Cryomyces minteri]
MAIENEPLLYAVVGFAAYHHTLTKPNGKIQDFLRYYNRSVSLLRLSLQKNQKHTVATILTMLQLATMEEFLGDWVNLLGHQKAAYEILTELYTPRTILQNETLRRIICWYIRFDLFAGIMSGSETVLSREWFAAYHDYYLREVRNNPLDFRSIYEETMSNSRLLATDVATLFARKSKGVIDDGEFAGELEVLSASLAAWEGTRSPTMTDPSKHIKDFPGAASRDPADIVDPFDPNFLYGDDLFTTNYALIDFWAIDLMFRFQLATVERKTPSPETEALAFKMCKMFEALEYYQQKLPGAILAAQATLSIASLILPKDQKHMTWCRKKFAKIESHGYIYPAAFRERLTDHWGEDVRRWWLPNDGDYPPMIRSIREWTEERTVKPRDSAGEDIREIKGIFSSWTLEDGVTKAEKGTETESDGLEHSDADGDGPMVYGSSPDYDWNRIPVQLGGR